MIEKYSSLSKAFLKKKNQQESHSSTPVLNRSLSSIINIPDFEPIKSNEISVLSESLKFANKKIEERDFIIEDIKSQCEVVASEIRRNWKECFDEKISEIVFLKVS